MLAFSYSELPVTVAYKGTEQEIAEKLEQHIDEIHYCSFVNGEPLREVTAEFLCEHEGQQCYQFKLQKEFQREAFTSSSRPGKEL